MQIRASVPYPVCPWQGFLFRFPWILGVWLPIGRNEWTRVPGVFLLAVFLLYPPVGVIYLLSAL
jgi:hypothetical protein